MYKYRAKLTDNELEELKRISKLDFSSYSEADIREEYIVPLMKLLGYSKEKDYSVSREDSFNLNESFLSVGSKRIRLDYIFSIRKQFFWLIDAKSGKNKKEIAREDVYQAYFYSIHPRVNCIYFGVCNGWYFNLYERDTFSDEMKPLLSIKSEQMVDSFYSLDKFIGVTQILPTLKKRTLNQVEMVLSAEIVDERLEEFKNEVSYSISKIRPKVLDNFRKNMKKIDNERECEKEKFLKSLSGWDIVNSLFDSCHNYKDYNDASKYIFKCEEFQKGGTSQCILLSRLMLDDLRPVSRNYFTSIVFFLHYLIHNDISSVHYARNGCSEKQVAEHLNYWIGEIFTRFQNREDIRLLTLFEAEYKRFIKYMILASKSNRKIIEKVVVDEKFLIEEELISKYVLCEARTLLQFMDDVTRKSMSIFLDKYYKSRTIKKALALEEINELKRANKLFKINNLDNYKLIKEELGSNWGELSFTESIFIDFDPLISAVSEILLRNDKVMNLVSEENKKHISYVASLGVSNYTKDLCDYYNIDYKTIKDDEIERKRMEFFDFKYNSNTKF